ncbi:MAG: hypothetical protein R2794_01935 [Chitinophagales bacterium]
MRFLLFCATITFAPALQAQEANENNTMDDLLRSNGMIFVVVGVILIILIGLILYLVSIDKKISRLEKEHKEKH